MGKKERRRYKNPVLSEIEEREKIKESVLKVFRQRYSSPTSGSGAIVVGKPEEKTASQPAVLDLTHESSSSMTDSEASSNSEKKTQKKRRRRKKQKTQRKVKKTESAERLDVARHLKVAHDKIQAAKPVSDSSRVSMITQNRITRNMGLFNRGKKSSTISREIHIPEAVRKKTQEDLKKILNHSDKSDDDNDDNLNISNNSPIILPKSKPGTISTNNRKLDLGYKSASSINCTPASAHNTSSTGGLSVPNSEDIGQVLPKDVPMEDISQVLIRNLDKKQFFPARNLYEENVEELRKIMKQNSFSTTPMSQKLQSKKTDSVKRSLLLDKFSPDKGRANSHKQSRPPSVTIPQAHRPPVQSCDKRQGDHSIMYRHHERQLTNPYGQTTTSSQNKYMDARELLKCDTSSIQPRQQRNEYSMAVSQNVKRFCNAELVDGKTLLKCNDQMIAEACHQMEQLTSKPQPMEIDRCSDNALRLLEQNDENRGRRYRSHKDNIQQIQQDILSVLPNDVDLTRSSQSSGFHGSQNSCHSKEEHISSRMILGQWQHNHSIPYSTGPQYELPYNHDKENVCTSMDILDYLDEPQQQEWARNPAIKQMSTDKDNIQMWIPSNVHVVVLPRKPTFESPSPEKLRPRFMH